MFILKCSHEHKKLSILFLKRKIACIGISILLSFQNNLFKIFVSNEQYFSDLSIIGLIVTLETQS